MTPELLKTLTTWDILECSEHCATLSSPATFGNDGACITFALSFNDKQFSLTDFSQHTFLANTLGVVLNKQRITNLNNTLGVSFAHFTEEGEIVATGYIQELQSALFDAFKLALSLSFNIEKWYPNFENKKFNQIVELALRNTNPNEHIIKNKEVIGITGHKISIPLTIETTKRMVYIEPIALQNGKLDWQAIYKTHGKFSDIKHIDKHNKRLIIIENNDEDLSAASTLLSEVGSIRLFTPSNPQVLANIAA